MRNCRLSPALADNSHLFAVYGAAADVPSDLSREWCWHTPNDCGVRAVYSTQHKIARKRTMRGLGLGDDHQPARVLVEAMDNPRSSNPADPRQARAAMADQGVDERPIRVSRRRVDNQPCGFVDDNQMSILEADIQWNRLRNWHRVCNIGKKYDEILAAADPQRRVALRYPFACHVAGMDQPFEPAAREGWKIARERAIKTLACLVGAGKDARGGATGRGRFGSHDRAFFVANRQRGLSGPRPMRALKVLVAVMGVMLIGGFALFVGVVVGRLSRSGTAPRSFAATTIIDIPRDARIGRMTAGTDRLVLELVLPEGVHQLVDFDLATGARLGTIELRAPP